MPRRDFAHIPFVSTLSRAGNHRGPGSNSSSGVRPNTRDPNIRTANPSCPLGADCLRISGTCGPFGVLNRICLDGPNATSANSLYTGFICNASCSESRGGCATIRCNSDADCPGVQRLCRDGVCVLPPPPLPPPPPPAPECTENRDCGYLQTCDNNQCTDVECVESFNCRFGQRCSERNTCVNRCIDSIWVEGREDFRICGRCVVGPSSGCEDDPRRCPINQLCAQSESGAGYCIPKCYSMPGADISVDVPVFIDNLVPRPPVGPKPSP